MWMRLISLPQWVKYRRDLDRPHINTRLLQPAFNLSIEEPQEGQFIDGSFPSESNHLSEVSTSRRPRPLKVPSVSLTDHMWSIAGRRVSIRSVQRYQKSSAQRCLLRALNTETVLIHMKPCARVASVKLIDAWWLCLNVFLWGRNEAAAAHWLTFTACFMSDNEESTN